MTFSHSDNDLARQLGLLGEQLDTNLSQEFAGLPSIDFSGMVNTDMLAPNNLKLEDQVVSQTGEQEPQDGDSDAECSDSDIESDNSDDDTAAAPQQPGTFEDLKAEGPTALPTSSNMGSLPVSSAGMHLRGISPSLRVPQSAPQSSQGFVPLSDINTASGQGHSHSVSSSPSSAFGNTSSPFDPANTSSISSEQQKGKRKADQMDLDTILDPAEKKKQRRLAKNRATAALSRYVTKVATSLLAQLLLKEQLQIVNASCHADSILKLCFFAGKEKRHSCRCCSTGCAHLSRKTAI